LATLVSEFVDIGKLPEERNLSTGIAKTSFKVSHLASRISWFGVLSGGVSSTGEAMKRHLNLAVESGRCWSWRRPLCTYWNCYRRSGTLSFTGTQVSSSASRIAPVVNVSPRSTLRVEFRIV
jgi:hypothetical protein